MFALGLTGSIATGKSSVLAMFAANGVPTFSSDQAVHDLYQDQAVEPLTELFPASIVEGKVDREKLGAHLVAHPELIAQLEAIVHPLVRARMEAFVRQCTLDKVDLAVLEIPLLFETAAHYPIDAVAVTWCSDTLQRQRALERPGMNVEKLNTILARQMSQSDKKARADFVIDTGTTLTETKSQVETIINACRNISDDKNSPTSQEPTF